MKRLIVLILCLPGMGSLPTFASHTPPPVSAEIQAKLNDFRADYVQMFQQEKAENIARYCDPDIRIMTVFQPTMMGPANTEAYFSAMFERFDIKSYTRAASDSWDLNEVVIEYGHFDLSMEKEGQSYPLKGKYMDVWQKEGTRLSLITQIWNYDHGVDFWDQMKFPAVPSVRIALEPHLPVTDDISFELAAYDALLEDVVSQGDAATWEQYFADHAVRLGNFTPICKGRAELNAYLVKHAAELPVFEKLDVRTDKIVELSNGYILQYASHIANWRRDAQSGVSTGKGMRVWQRQENGNLKMISQISTYD